MLKFSTCCVLCKSRIFLHTSFKPRTSTPSSRNRLYRSGSDAAFSSTNCNRKPVGVVSLEILSERRYTFPESNEVQDPLCSGMIQHLLQMFSSVGVYRPQIM